METQSKDVEVVRGDFDAGIGMGVTDGYRWALHTAGPYLVDYHDPFMVIDDGKQYVAVPYTRPEFRVRALPVPMAYTTPTWGGVALIDQQGQVEHLPPATARDHPALADQRLVPFDLVRRKVAATAYRNGIVNTLPLVGSHNEQIEVAAVPGEGNDQPFLVRTRSGLTYVVAAEPYGDTQGLRELWVVDGRTAEYEVVRSAAGSTLLGPRKAADFVRQAARQTDWDRFTPAEPIPVVVNGTLYWELRVVPTDASGISYVAFVDAESSDVVEVETTAAVVEFLRGERPASDDATGGGDGGDRRQPTVVVVKRNADGEVVATLNVYENESVVVRQPNGSARGTPVPTPSPTGG